MSGLVERLLAGPDSGDGDSRTAWWDDMQRSLARHPDAWLEDVGTTGMSRDQAWLLLSWVEDAASRAVAEDRPELVELAAFALSLLEAGPLDRRDVMVVALLLHRGSVVAGHDFLSNVRRGCARAGELGASCLTWLGRVRPETPATHEESGTGSDFSFRRRDSAIDVDELLRKYGKSHPRP